MNNMDRYANFLGNQSQNPYASNELNEAVKFPKSFKTEPSIMIFLNNDGQIENFEYSLEERDMSSNMPTIRYDLSYTSRSPKGKQNISLSSCNLENSKEIKALQDKLKDLEKVQNHANECYYKAQEAAKMGADIQKTLSDVKRVKVI